MKKLRNIWKFKWLNDGFRSLNESIVYPEVAEALAEWKRNSNIKLEVIYSSTDYKSFTGRKVEEALLKEWLNNNLSVLTEKCNSLNT